MKKLVVVFILCFSVFTNAQTEESPVVWVTSVEKISDTEYDLVFNASILNEWHLYSQHNPDEASLPMVISISEGETGFKLIGKAKENKTYTEYTEIWGKDEIFFKNKATITQRIELTNTELTSVKLHLFAQVCKVACIQIEDDYTFSLNGVKVVKAMCFLN